MAESGNKSSRIVYAAGGAGAIMLGAAQTKPEDAISNLAGWLELIGFDAIPSFLATRQADNWGTAIGLALIALSGLIWYWRRSRIAEPETAAISGRAAVNLRLHPDYIAETAKQRAIDEAERRRKSSAMLSGLMGGFKTLADIADERKEDERQQKITQAELDRENQLALQKRRRDVIADLRDIGLRYAHNDSEIPFREHLESQRPYVDIRRHLNEKYLSRLNAGRTSYAQADGALYPVLVQELFDELDRLEGKWNL